MATAGTLKVVTAILVTGAETTTFNPQGTLTPAGRACGTVMVLVGVQMVELLTTMLMPHGTLTPVGKLTGMVTVLVGVQTVDVEELVLELVGVVEVLVDVELLLLALVLVLVLVLVLLLVLVLELEILILVLLLLLMTTLTPHFGTIPAGKSDDNVMVVVGTHDVAEEEVSAEVEVAVLIGMYVVQMSLGNRVLAAKKAPLGKMLALQGPTTVMILGLALRVL